MNINLLNIDVQSFINDQLHQNITKLALQKNPFPNIEWITILEQIESKTKAKEKLPSWFSTKNIIYPPKISIEQTSSEVTASYKSNLISGTSLIDLTGGLGVDDFYFSKQFKKIGLKASRRIEFYNGKIDCRLLEYELYGGSKEKEKIIKD